LAKGDVDLLVTEEQWQGLAPADLCVQDPAERSLCRPLPVLLFRPAGRSPDPQWALAEGGVVLRPVDSAKRLVDASAFMLHRRLASMTQAERDAVESINAAAGQLAGKKVLIVDDDVRNIFALATVLESQGMRVVSAENGRDAIRLVEGEPGIDAVLMDIMMPEMDGMQTMRELRKLPAGKRLPLIAVTAKAMKGDREKCIDAGAWDYLSKPVETAQLLAVLRGWLCR
jgi:CheY-like chemotaxis protein